MKKEIAEMLIQHNSDLQLHEDYSGRGMYGKNTTGISCENMAQVMEAVGNAFYGMIEDAMVDGGDYDPTEAEDLANALADLRTDSLGLGIIVY